jgi:hypothetical protein
MCLKAVRNRRSKEAQLTQNKLPPTLPSKHRSIVIAFATLCIFSCLWRCSENTKSWNSLGGSYEKIGEFIVRNGYWVEEYIDTITNFRKVLFVNRDNNKFISDSLNVGVFDSTHRLDYGNVELNEREDPEIVAIVKTDDSLYHKNIVKAWRANTVTGKFEPCSVDGIRAKNAKKFYGL